MRGVRGGSRGALWGLEAFIWGPRGQLPLSARTAQHHASGWPLDRPACRLAGCTGRCFPLAERSRPAGRGGAKAGTRLRDVINRRPRLNATGGLLGPKESVLGGRKRTFLGRKAAFWGQYLLGGKRSRPVRRICSSRRRWRCISHSTLSKRASRRRRAALPGNGEKKGEIG